MNDSIDITTLVEGNNYTYFFLRITEVNPLYTFRAHISRGKFCVHNDEHNFGAGVCGLSEACLMVNMRVIAHWILFPQLPSCPTMPLLVQSSNHVMDVVWYVKPSYMGTFIIAIAWLVKCRWYPRPWLNWSFFWWPKPDRELPHEKKCKIFF